MPLFVALACGGEQGGPAGTMGGNGSGGAPTGGVSGGGVSAGGASAGMTASAGASAAAAGASAGNANTAGSSAMAGSGGSPGGSGGASGGTSGSAGKGGASGSGAGGASGSGAGGAPDQNFYVFLLIGQSNMEGVPRPESADLATNPRLKVLAYDNCSGIGRSYNQWYTAAPPLHGCGAGVGPGDNFAKTLANAFPQATIGLVPNAISGVDIDYFRKGVVSARRSEFRIPPDNHWSGAYEWVIERARLAQRSGVIRGILFHQGESDTGNAQWVGKVRGMVSDLRADLGLGEVPFIAGELLYGGCCASHNPLVNQLPGQITRSAVIPANGLAGMDTAHFDLAGQRELGRRYGAKMVELLAP